MRTRFDFVTFLTLLTNHRRFASVFAPHVAGQNVQLGPVLGHRAASAPLTQNFDNFLVAQRRTAICILHQVEDHFFDAGVAHRRADCSL